MLFFFFLVATFLLDLFLMDIIKSNLFFPPVHQMTRRYDF
jgi:hypothetical protein